MCYVFFFNDTATTEIYTLSLHDALPILADAEHKRLRLYVQVGLSDEFATESREMAWGEGIAGMVANRSEEHTSELQSHSDLVCRLLLEKKKLPIVEV